MNINLKRYTLFSKLSVTIMLFIVFITFVITMVSTQLSAYMIRNEAYSNNMIYLNKLSNLLENKLHDIDKTLVNFCIKEIDADNIENTMSDQYKRYTVYKKLEQLKDNNNFIESVYIFFNSGDEVYYHLYSEYDNGICLTSEFFDNFIYYKFIREGHLSEVVGARALTHKTAAGKETTNNLVTVMKTLPLSNAYTENAIIINIKVEYMTALINDSYLPKNSIMLISDWDRKPILSYYNSRDPKESSQSNYIDEIRNQIRRKIKERSSLSLNINDTKYYVTEYKSANSNRIFTLALPESEMLKPISIYNSLLFLLFTLIIALSVMFSSIIDRRYFQPVVSLLHMFKNRRAENDVLSVDFSLKSKKKVTNELAQLSGYIDNIISANIDQKKQLENYFEYYRERVLYSLLNLDAVSGEMAEKDNIFHSNKFKGFCIILINIKRIINGLNMQDYNSFSNKLKEHVIGVMIKYGFVQKVQINIQKTVLLLCFDNEINLTVITQEVKALLEAFTNSAYSVNTAIGSICNSINEIKDSYQQAEKALLYSLESEDSQVIDANEFENASGRNYTYPDQIESQIVRDIIKNKTEGVLKGIANYCSYIRENRISLFNAKKYALTLVYNISLNLSKTNRYANKSIFMESVYDDLETLATLKEIENWLTELFERNFGEAFRGVNGNNKELIESVINYINSYYMKDIGLNIIAEYVYLSPSYFAKIFKEVTGSTFTDYLISVRMKIAGDLLQNTDLKITDVYERVGYLSVQSFNKIFKSYYSCTPSEYRKKSASEFLQKDIKD